MNYKMFYITYTLNSQKYSKNQKQTFAKIQTLLKTYHVGLKKCY